MGKIYAIGEAHPENIAAYLAECLFMPVYEKPIFSFKNASEFLSLVSRCGKLLGENGEEVKHYIQLAKELLKVMREEARIALKLRPDIIYSEGIQPKYLRFRETLASNIGAKCVYLDKGFEPYKRYLNGKISARKLRKGREPHWKKIILKNLPNEDEKALMIVGSKHLARKRNTIEKIKRIFGFEHVGKLPELLEEEGIEIEVLRLFGIED